MDEESSSRQQWLYLSLAKTSQYGFFYDAL